ncbi:hypothetical protein, partial [Pseudomonas aeruginosa]|uniref:hypothetical protein n=1 Tax=Pseudomonas aeruginosa TaxID=287 RepID=UPI001922B417
GLVMNIVKPESIAVFCLTPGGVRLARRLQTHLPLTCFTSDKLLEEGFLPFNGSFGDTLREAFKQYSAGGGRSYWPNGAGYRAAGKRQNDRPCGGGD